MLFRSRGQTPLRHAACQWGRSAAAADLTKAPPQASRRRSRGGGSRGVPRRRGLPQRLLRRHIVQAVAAAPLRRARAARRPLPLPLTRQTRPQTLPLHCAALHSIPFQGGLASAPAWVGVRRRSSALRRLVLECPPTPPLTLFRGGWRWFGSASRDRRSIKNICFPMVSSSSARPPVWHQLAGAPFLFWSLIRAQPQTLAPLAPPAHASPAASASGGGIARSALRESCWKNRTVQARTAPRRASVIAFMLHAMTPAPPCRLRTRRLKWNLFDFRPLLPPLRYGHEVSGLLLRRPFMGGLLPQACRST